MGESLHQRGFTVYGPRLAGHGAHPVHLAHLRWQDWYLSALDGYHLLRQNCRQVFVAGLSMGGLLTLLLAANVPVDAIAVMAAPLMLPNARALRMARWIKYIRPYIHLPDTSDFPQRLKAEQTRRAEAPLGRVRYDLWPYQAIEELQSLMRVAEAQLPGVCAPALLVYSQSDATVPFENLAYVRRGISSPSVKIAILQKSGHILPQDQEYEQVLTHVGDFFASHAAHQQA